MDATRPESPHQDVRRMLRMNNWTTASDEVHVNLLLDESAQSGLRTGSFRPKAWQSIWNLYKQITREDTTLLQLKGRWKTLKKLYKLYSSLLAKSGWSWDHDNERPTLGSAMVWEEIIELNKEYKVCRDKPFPLFRKIQDLVAASIATGEYARHSGAPVGGDDFVLDLDESSGSSGSPGREVANNTIPPHSGARRISTGDGPLGCKRKQSTTPSSHFSKKKSSDHTVEALNRWVESSDHRSRILEEKKQEADSFSYKTCMDKLSKTPGLSDLEVFVACKALMGSHDVRVFFMTMRQAVVDIWLSELMIEHHDKAGNK